MKPPRPSPAVPAGLLRKYDRPGPRYTSYPPATRFGPPPAPEPGTPGPVSLYVHLPFCRRQCLYCGCTNLIASDPGEADRYLDLLEREFDLRKPLLPADSEVVRLHLGGGTPTFLSPEQLDRLGRALRNRFPFAETAEVAIEIDPRTLDPEKTSALRRAGFNRASLGIQDLDPAVQRAIGRIQPIDLVAGACRTLRDAGFDSVNFDLIYGLPRQTPDSFARTLQTAVELAPDRFAVYGYAHVPWLKPLQKRYEADLPDPETRIRLLQLVIDVISGAGYEPIGMDHFARPEDPLAQALRAGTLQRDFQGYSTHAGTDLHAFGLSAISRFADRYLQNQKNLSLYRAEIEAGRLPFLRGYRPNEDDRIRRALILRIMCDLFVDYRRLSAETGVDVSDYFRNEIAGLDDLESDGLLHREADGLRITPLGRLFVRIVAMRFDPHLDEESSGAPRYSRTV